MSQDRAWIKREIAKILLQEGLIEEQGGRHSDLFNKFVAPFTDIVKGFRRPKCWKRKASNKISIFW